MEKAYLRETYKEFRKCYTDADFIEKVNKLNTSREYCYRMLNGIGTYDINDVLDLIKDNGSWGELKGFIKVELHHINGYLDVLEIPIDINVEDWNEEYKVFDSESYLICDVEEW